MSDFFDDNNNYDNNYYDNNSSYDNGGYSNDPYDNGSYNNDPYGNSYSDSSANNDSYDTNSSDFGSSYDYKNTPSSYDAYKKKAANAKVAPLSSVTAKKLKKTNMIALIIVLALSLIISCLTVITPLNIASKSIENQGVYYNSNIGFNDVDINAKNSDMLVIYQSGDLSADISAQEVGDKQAVYLTKGDKVTVYLSNPASQNPKEPVRVFETSKAKKVSDIRNISLENGAAILMYTPKQSGIISLESEGYELMMYDIAKEKFIKNNNVTKGNEYYALIWNDKDSHDYVDGFIDLDNPIINSDITAVASSILEKNIVIKDSVTYLFKPTYTGDYHIYCSSWNVDVNIIKSNGQELNINKNDEVSLTKGTEYEIQLSVHRESEEDYNGEESNNNEVEPIKNVNFAVARVAEFAEPVELNGGKEILYYDPSNNGGNYTMIMSGNNVSAKVYNDSLANTDNYENNVNDYYMNSYSEKYIVVENAETFNMFYEGDATYMHVGDNRVYSYNNGYRVLNYEPTVSYDYVLTNEDNSIITVYDENANMVEPKSQNEGLIVYALEGNVNYKIIFTNEYHYSSIDTRTALYGYAEYAQGAEMSLPSDVETIVKGVQPNWMYTTKFNGDINVYDYNDNVLDASSFFVDVDFFFINASSYNYDGLVNGTIAVDDIRNHSKLYKDGYSDLAYGYKPMTSGNYTFTFDARGIYEYVDFYIINEDGSYVDDNNGVSVNDDIGTITCYLEKDKQYGVKMSSNSAYFSVPCSVMASFKANDTIKVINGDIFAISGLDNAKYKMTIQGANIRQLSNYDVSHVLKSNYDSIYFMADGTSTYYFSVEDYDTYDDIDEFDVVIEECKVGSINRGYEINREYNYVDSALELTNPGHYYMLTYGLADATRNITINDSEGAEVVMTTDDIGTGFDIVEGETYTINIVTEKDVTYNMDILFAHEIVVGEQETTEGLYYFQSRIGMDYKFSTNNSQELTYYTDIENNMYEQSNSEITITPANAVEYLSVAGAGTFSVEEMGFDNVINDIAVDSNGTSVKFKPANGGNYRLAATNANVTISLYDASDAEIVASAGDGNIKAYDGLVAGTLYTIKLTSTDAETTSIKAYECINADDVKTVASSDYYYLDFSTISGYQSIEANSANIKLYYEDDMSAVAKSANNILVFNVDSIHDGAYIDVDASQETTLKITSGILALSNINTEIAIGTSENTALSYNLIVDSTGYYNISLENATSDHVYMVLYDEDGYSFNSESTNGSTYCKLTDIYLYSGTTYSIKLYNSNNIEATCDIIITNSWDRTDADFTGHYFIEYKAKEAVSTKPTRIVSTKDPNAVITVYLQNKNNTPLATGKGYVDVTIGSQEALYIDVVTSDGVATGITSMGYIKAYNDSLHLYEYDSRYVFIPENTANYRIELTQNRGAAIYTDPECKHTADYSGSAYALEKGVAYYVEITDSWYPDSVTFNLQYYVSDMTSSISFTEKTKIYMYNDSQYLNYYVNVEGGKIFINGYNEGNRYFAQYNGTTNTFVIVPDEEGKPATVSFEKYAMEYGKQTLQVRSSEMKYEFIPDETGLVSISYNNSSDVYASFYDETGSYISNLSYNANIFNVKAGETYKIGLKSSYYNETSSVYIAREIKETSSMQITGNAYFYFDLTDTHAKFRIKADNSAIKVSTSSIYASGYDIVSSDNIAEARGNGGTYYFVEVKPTSTDTATNVEFMLTGIDNELESATVLESVTKYKYMPKYSGTYKIMTSNSGTSDPYLYLYDSDGTTVLAEDDNSVLTSPNFSDAMLEYNLEADKAYYIGVKNNNTVDGTCTLHVVKKLTLGTSTVDNNSIYYVGAEPSTEKYSLMTNRLTDYVMYMYSNDSFASDGSDNIYVNLDASTERYFKMSGSTDTVELTIAPQQFIADHVDRTYVSNSPAAEYPYVAETSDKYRIHADTPEILLTVYDGTTMVADYSSEYVDFQAEVGKTYTIKAKCNSYYNYADYELFVSRYAVDDVTETIDRSVVYYVPVINLNKVVTATNDATINVYSARSFTADTEKAKTAVGSIELTRANEGMFVEVVPVEGTTTDVTFTNAPFTGRLENVRIRDTEQTTLRFSVATDGVRRIGINSYSNSPSVEIYSTTADGVQDQVVGTLNISNREAIIDFPAGNYIMKLNSSNGYSSSNITLTMYEMAKDGDTFAIDKPIYLLVSQMSNDFKITAEGADINVAKSYDYNSAYDVDVVDEYVATSFMSHYYVSIVPRADATTPVNVTIVDGSISRSTKDLGILSGESTLKYTATHENEMIWIPNPNYSTITMTLKDAANNVIVNSVDIEGDANNGAVMEFTPTIGDTYYIVINSGASQSLNLKVGYAVSPDVSYEMNKNDIAYMPMDSMDTNNYYVTFKDHGVNVYNNLRMSGGRMRTGSTNVTRNANIAVFDATSVTQGGTETFPLYIRRPVVENNEFLDIVVNSEGVSDGVNLEFTAPETGKYTLVSLLKNTDPNTIYAWSVHDGGYTMASYDSQMNDGYYTYDFVAGKTYNLKFNSTSYYYANIDLYIMRALDTSVTTNMTSDTLVYVPYISANKTINAPGATIEIYSTIPENSNNIIDRGVDSLRLAGTDDNSGYIVKICVPAGQNVDVSLVDDATFGNSTYIKYNADVPVLGTFTPAYTGVYRIICRDYDYPSYVEFYNIDDDTVAFAEMPVDGRVLDVELTANTTYNIKVGNRIPGEAGSAHIDIYAPITLDTDVAIDNTTWFYAAGDDTGIKVTTTASNVIILSDQKALTPSVIEAKGNGTVETYEYHDYSLIKVTPTTGSDTVKVTAKAHVGWRKNMAVKNVYSTYEFTPQENGQYRIKFANSADYTIIKEVRLGSSSVIVSETTSNVFDANMRAGQTYTIYYKSNLTSTFYAEMTIGKVVDMSDSNTTISTNANMIYCLTNKSVGDQTFLVSDNESIKLDTLNGTMDKRVEVTDIDYVRIDNPTSATGTITVDVVVPPIKYIGKANCNHEFAKDASGRYVSKNKNRNNESAGIEFLINVKLRVTISYSVSSESGWDKFYLYHTQDNITTAKVNGLSGIQNDTITITCEIGDKLKMKYTKDGSNSKYEDTVTFEFINIEFL